MVQLCSHPIINSTSATDSARAASIAFSIVARSSSDGLLPFTHSSCSISEVRIGAKPHRFISDIAGEAAPFA
jgi:hypothetical protein